MIFQSAAVRCQMADMHLYVLRHAIAEEAAEGQADADRQLTDDGVKRLKQAIRGLKALEVPIERIVTSPWRRALQTAEQLAAACDQPLVISPLLTRPPSAELLTQLGERRESTIVVGHEPWLSELISWLAFGDSRHGEAIEVKKAAFVWLVGSAIPGGMTIRALVPPRVLRMLGRK